MKAVILQGFDVFVDDMTMIGCESCDVVRFCIFCIW